MIVAAVVVTTLAAALYLVLAEPTYKAEADLLVTPVASDDPVTQGLPLIQESNDPIRDVETAARLATTRDVAARVKRNLNLEGDPSSIQSRCLGRAGCVEQHRRDHGRGVHRQGGGRARERLRRGCGGAARRRPATRSSTSASRGCRSASTRAAARAPRSSARSRTTWRSSRTCAPAATRPCASRRWRSSPTRPPRRSPSSRSSPASSPGCCWALAARSRCTPSIRACGARSSCASASAFRCSPASRSSARPRPRPPGPGASASARRRSEGARCRHSTCPR